MKKNKKALVSLYVLALLTFVMIFSYVILSNMEKINNDLKIGDLNQLELATLSKNAYINLENNLALNKDGDGFLDNHYCPEITINFKEYTDSLQTNLFFKEENNEKKIYCKSENSGVETLLYFSYNDLTEEEKKSKSSIFEEKSGNIFSKMFYGSEEISLNNSFSGSFSGGTFSIGSFPGSDNFDDNLNSDDFKISSKDGVLYPNDFFDNDADSRKNIYGLILDNKKRVNIFANTEESNQFILNNTNNILPFKKLPELDNSTFSIEFSEEITGRIEILEVPNSGNSQRYEIPLSGKNIEIPNLNFVNNFYQIFLNSENNLEGISYKILDKSGAYINPIKDDYSDKMEIYQNYVFNHAGVDILKSKIFVLKK